MKMDEIREIYDSMTEQQQRAICVLVGLCLQEEDEDEDEDEDETIKHYGVKGMKWGVRRYRNRDGEYIKRSLKDFDTAVSTYDKVSASAKNKTATRKEVRTAKKKVNTAYSRVKLANRAEKGKKLVEKGKTLVEGDRYVNKLLRNVVNTTVATGSAVGAIALSSPELGLALYSGQLAVNAMLSINRRNQRRNMETYYGYK